MQTLYVSGYCNDYQSLLQCLHSADGYLLQRDACMGIHALCLRICIMLLCISVCVCVCVCWCVCVCVCVVMYAQRGGGRERERERERSVDTGFGNKLYVFVLHHRHLMLSIYYKSIYVHVYVLYFPLDIFSPLKESKLYHVIVYPCVLTSNIHKIGV